MNTFFSQFKKEAEGIRLTEREREYMRGALEDAIKNRSLVESPIRITPSPYLFLHQKIVSPLAFVLLLTIVGGSTAYAAEAAIPGDVLYSVKLNLNEPVRAALAQSAEAKAEWHAEAARRRMQEAEALAARGTLTSEVKVALEANIDSHAEALEESIAEVEERDPATAADISTRFESAVLAHSALVARLGGDVDSDSSRESVKFAERLKAHGEKIALASRTTSVKAERSANGDIALMATAPSPEGTSTTMSASIVIRDPSDDAILERLEMSASTTLAEAQAELDALDASLDATTSARVKAQIGKIRALLENFKKDRGEGYGEKEHVQKLLRDASTMKAFLEAQGKFKGHFLLPAPGVSENGDDENSGGDEKNGANSGIVPVGVPGALPL